MSFLAPGRLWLLLVVGAVAAVYVVVQRRRPQYAVRFTNLELLASVAPKRPGWRRHVPAAAMALALAAMVLGLAQPVREERVPKEAATVMLVLDTSASMQATDVAPSRLEAAVTGARSFVDDLPEQLLVGLVAFDGVARVVAPPTIDHESVGRALARLETGPGTAAGEAVYVALSSIADTAETLSAEAEPNGAAESPEEEQEDEDDSPAAAIVLLSDGVTTVGRPVEDAAVAAAEQGVPVTTIAFGTDEGEVEVQSRWVPVPADPEAMTEVAETTGGRFFEAFSEDQLRSVYEDIGTRVGFETEQRDISLTFVTIGTVLLALGMAASLLWTSRVL